MTLAAAARRPVGGWRTPAAPPALPGDGVHVWRAALDGATGSDERAWDCLSRAEQQRAGTFLRPRDRERFVARRALLRILLAGYLGGAPQALPLRAGAHGKPEVPDSGGRAALSFSCSSSRGLALYAFTRTGAVGVDVEALRRLPERAAMTRLCCSPREQAALGRVPAQARDAAFLDAWTRKEAYLKAVGVGLSWAPSRVEVALGPDAAPAVLAVDGDRAGAARWSLHALSPAVGYVGAVAVDRPGVRLEVLDAATAASG